MHFRRTSLLIDTRLSLYLQEIPLSDGAADDLYAASCLHSITHALATVPFPTETYLESLIPTPFQVASLDSEIQISSAMIYISLHPLFTHPNRLAGRSLLDIPSPRLILAIAKSAAVIIDHFIKLNQRHMIVSIWLAAERVLEAGAVWAAYLIHQSRMSGRGPHGIIALGTDFALAPIVKVSSLLASFAVRWKPGLTYVECWETLLELLWKMV
jgi:hypothetical protein